MPSAFVSACRRRPLHVRAVVACAGRNPIDALALVSRLRQRDVDRLGRCRLGRHCVTALLQTARSRRFERPGQHVICDRTGLAWVNGLRIRGREIEPLHDGPEMSFLFLDIDRKPCSQSRVRQVDLLAALLQPEADWARLHDEPDCLSPTRSPLLACSRMRGRSASRWQRAAPDAWKPVASPKPLSVSAFESSACSESLSSGARSPVARSASSPARVETSRADALPSF